MKVFVVEKEADIRGIILKPGEYPIYDFRGDGFYILHENRLKIFFPTKNINLYGKVVVKLSK